MDVPGFEVLLRNIPSNIYSSPCTAIFAGSAARSCVHPGIDLSLGLALGVEDSIALAIALTISCVLRSMCLQSRAGFAVVRPFTVLALELLCRFVAIAIAPAYLAGIFLIST